MGIVGRKKIQKPVKFCNYKRCPKCGYYLRYVGDSIVNYLAERNLLRRKCVRCRAYWLEYPLDKVRIT